MKDIRSKILDHLKSGHCTPQLSVLAKRLKQPSTTLHYNVKKLEEEGKILTYKAVLNHKKIGEGFCAFVLLSLSDDEYADPERIAKDLAAFPEIESVDICTGDWEMIVKIREVDSDAYYSFVKRVLKRKGVSRTKTLMSLKQVKSEYVLVR